jgi:hypothetical protein
VHKLPCWIFTVSIIMAEFCNWFSASNGPDQLTLNISAYVMPSNRVRLKIIFAETIHTVLKNLSKSFRSWYQHQWTCTLAGILIFIMCVTLFTRNPAGHASLAYC